MMPLLVLALLAPGWRGEASADVGSGVTSNVERARSGGQADTFLQVSANLAGGGLGRRVRGLADVDARFPLGLPELRRVDAHGILVAEQPAGPVLLGASLSLRYEDEVTVFVQTGTLPGGAARAGVSGRVQPFVAVEADDMRFEGFGLLGAKSVSGAEDYTLTDGGGGVAARWSPSPLLYLRGQGLLSMRRFDGLNVRTRDGLRPATAPALELGIVEGAFAVGTAPLDGLQVVLRYVLTRTYDTYDGFHSSVRHALSLDAGYARERGLVADLWGRLGAAGYEVRITRPDQPGEETLIDAGASVGWAIRRWLEPRLTYEHHRASSSEQGTLYEEHVGLIAIRGRL